MSYLNKKISQKLYRQKNKDKAKKYFKEYYLKNNEKLNIYKKEYREKNKDKIKKDGKEYYIKNKNKILLKQQEYRRLHPEKRTIYTKFKKEKDTQFKLGIMLRSRLFRALRGNYKTGSAVRDLGCTISEVKIYIEKKFKPGMNWDNWARFGWHIDHIKALTNFNLSDRNQFLEACHYTNLQPMWWDENIRKSNKTDYYGK